MSESGGAGQPPWPGRHGVEPRESKSKLPWGILIIVGLVLLGIVVVPLIGRATSNSPKGWLDDHYSYVSGNEDSSGRVYDSDDDPDQVVAAIDTGTNPSEKRQEDSVHYLRYKSDWLVTVEADQDGTGTEIRLYEFDAGYRHYGPALFFWSSHYQSGGGSFRGGGSGSGK